MDNLIIRGVVVHFSRGAVALSGLLLFMLVGSVVAEPPLDQKGHLDPEVVKQEGFVSTEEYEGVWQRTLSDGSQEFKVIKDGLWAVKQHSADGKNVTVYHGGSYVMPGDVFVETVGFVESGDKSSWKIVRLPGQGGRRHSASKQYGGKSRCDGVGQG